MLKSFSLFLNEAIDDQLEDLDEGVTNGKKVGEMSPEVHKNFRHNEALGKQWHEEHPIHHQNIVNHYNAATEGERSHGHAWYSGAHHIAKAIAKDTGVSTHTMAGLISNYSPQTHWHTNIHTAASVAREKRPRGGKGDGVLATETQKHFAHKMLKGEHYDKVLKGHKTKAFAHLIEHGGNKDDAHPKVVVDRHAYSVAAGGRIPDAAFQQVKLKSQKGYKHVSDAYTKAAHHLSEQHGHKIHPHQVQATTWLVRQRLNSESEHQAKGSSTTKKASNTNKSRWDDYAKQHHPSVVGKEPGTGHD